MAKMNKRRIREMSLDEKRKKLAEYKEELAYQRSLLASGNVTDSPGKIRFLRKTIARFKTFINQDLREMQYEALDQE